MGVLSPEGTYAVSMPSDAAQLPNGDWAILDGVNNRVVITDGDGQGLASIGEDVLAAPLGLDLDHDGNLWIADTGNHRVVELTRDGTLIAEYALLTAEGDQHAPDAVDLAFDSDGVTLWVVDNDNHRIQPLNTETGEWGETWGEFGEGFDQFDYPFSIAITSTGRLGVIDVLNSRAQIRDPSFDFTFEIRSWGVNAGDLYRPKGIAFDDAGRIFITDSIFQVIQVFNSAGSFVGVLGDGDEVRKFRTPTRLTFDREGNLVVVEMRANRVTLWSVEQ